MKQTILITGASRGLGLFLAKKYLEEGNIVFAGVRDISASLVKTLKEEYKDRLIPVPMEVSDTSSVIKAADIVRSYTDKIDILINNAAIHTDDSYQILENTNVDECLQVYNVNCVGSLRVAKAFLSMVRNSQNAKIINVSSESGSLSTCCREKEFDYCMSKAALNMQTKLLSNYLKKDNIIVIAVHPGWMRTDMGGMNADLDPYETACRLVDLFKSINSIDSPVFIDNEGKEYPC